MLGDKIIERLYRMLEQFILARYEQDKLHRLEATASPELAKTALRGGRSTSEERDEYESSGDQYNYWLRQFHPDHLQRDLKDVATLQGKVDRIEQALFRPVLPRRN